MSSAPSGPESGPDSRDEPLFFRRQPAQPQRPTPYRVNLALMIPQLCLPIGVAVHGFGSHGIPTPCQFPKQSQCAMTTQAPSGRQQAPLGWSGGGLQATEALTAQRVVRTRCSDEQSSDAGAGRSTSTQVIPATRSRLARSGANAPGGEDACRARGVSAQPAPRSGCRDAHGAARTRGALSVSPPSERPARAPAGTRRWGRSRATERSDDGGVRARRSEATMGAFAHDGAKRRWGKDLGQPPPGSALERPSRTRSLRNPPLPPSPQKRHKRYHWSVED
jgi:hypothetical protein